MPTGFWRTSEGEKEYEKLNIPYDNTIEDIAYQSFITITNQAPPDKPKRRREILSLIRKVVGSREFIIWNERLVGYDGLGQERHFFRGSMGQKPIRPTYISETVTWLTANRELR
jgi:hypothetical protein